MSRLDFGRTQNLGRDEQSGGAMIHNLGNAAHRGSHHGRFAGHGFEIDDSERLVHRRTDEDGGMRVQRDDFLFWQHLANPDDRVRALGAGAVNRLCHLSLDFRCVGRTGTQDNLNTRVEVPDSVHEMNDALLARDAADK